MILSGDWINTKKKSHKVTRRLRTAQKSRDEDRLPVMTLSARTPLSAETIEKVLAGNNKQEMLRMADGLRNWLGGVRELTHDLEQLIGELEGSNPAESTRYTK